MPKTFCPSDPHVRLGVPFCAREWLSAKQHVPFSSAIR
jgi:hypothetical protein